MNDSHSSHGDGPWEHAADDLCFASAVELAQLFAAKRVSPVEAVKQLFRRIAAVNPALNAFVLTDEERALDAARNSEHRWFRGAPLGPLDGVPFSAKDTLQVAGYPSRRGSLASSDVPVAENAPAVARLLEQGAVFFGITTTPEYGFGPVTHSPLTGITRNPWNVKLGSGGSSGGAAASIAAGIGAIALATDAGGSIRIPSSLCGVVGFKATGGQVPTYPPNIAGALSCAGPIVRSVADARLVLSVVATGDARDPEAAPPAHLGSHEEARTDLKGVRIAVATRMPHVARVDQEVVDRINEAADVFASLGASIAIDAPDTGEPLPIYLALFRAGYGYTLGDLSKDRLALVGPLLREAIEEGRRMSLRDYLAAQDQRRTLARRMHEFHREYDVLLTPTIATTAFTAEDTVPESYADLGHIRSWTPFAFLFNLAQQPAISVPCGLSAAGLPIGLQISAPRYRDDAVLRLAASYERAAGVALRPPMLAFSS